eukprot:1878173-Rhodomonas_salina.1
MLDVTWQCIAAVQPWSARTVASHPQASRDDPESCLGGVLRGRGRWMKGVRELERVEGKRADERGAAGRE